MEHADAVSEPLTLLGRMDELLNYRPFSVVGDDGHEMCLEGVAGCVLGPLWCEFRLTNLGKTTCPLNIRRESRFDPLPFGRERR